MRRLAVLLVGVALVAVGYGVDPAPAPPAPAAVAVTTTTRPADRCGAPPRYRWQRALAQQPPEHRWRICDPVVRR